MDGTEGRATAMQHANVRTLAGRYVLYDEIGHGGMATVHLARAVGSGGFVRTVAVKRLFPQFVKDPDFVAMFLDEVRLSARIRHPNVIATLDAVSADGELFLVMEYVLGESLGRVQARLRARGEAMPVAIAMSIVASALHGLHAAHDTRGVDGELLGVVHRDVSPDNILVGVDGMARVLDFGVAKARGRLQATREGRLKGKLGYMSPEQMHGRVSRQSDVYSAAVVLWELLAGARLGRSMDGAEAVQQALHQDVPPPSARRPVLEPDAPWQRIDALVLRGLAREPRARFATAREMALALEAAVALASATEIGAWVEHVMGDDIAARARRVSELEREPITLRGATAAPAVVDAATDAQADAKTAPRGIAVRRRRALHVSIALVAAVTLAVGVVISSGDRRHDAPIATAPAALDPSVAPPASVPPPPEASEPHLVTDGTPAALPADRDEAPKRAPVDTPRRAPRRSNRRNCDPPFVVDSAGNKRFKMECL